MFEAQSKNRMGLLIWMSHPTWPSFVWQTYDYYLEPTAAYFGSKKASEPLHIQWNPLTEAIEVVNYSGGNAPGLTASVQLLNIDGTVASGEDARPWIARRTACTPMLKMEYPASISPVHFLRLQLKRGTDLVSENFYWRGDRREQLPGAPRPAQSRNRGQHQSTACRRPLDTHHRVAATRQGAGADGAAEAGAGEVRRPHSAGVFSDNYIALMPGEKRVINIDVAHADTRGEAPRVVVEGFNVQ